MNKKLIINELIARAKKELELAEEAFASLSSYKIADDMKQESKYDTRGIEAGQLAGAQQKRVEELKLEVQMLEEIPVRAFAKDEVASIGALVKIKHNNAERLYFISSTAGGAMVKLGEEAVLIISVFSPLGSEALGLKAGENFDIETANGTREYHITNIY